jgi:hypothetical protein
VAKVVKLRPKPQTRPAQADSGEARMTQPRLTAQIARELYIAMERLSADPELLSIVYEWIKRPDGKQPYFISAAD